METYAASSNDAIGGTYYGPLRLNEVRGYPTKVKIAPQAMDTEVSSRLWEVSETLTKVKFI